VAGVGETGVWRAGVWVEPQDAEGDFALSAAGETEFTGRFSFAGVMELEATSVLGFDGDPLFRGEFDFDAASDLTFTGTFVGNPGVGTFAFTGSADVNFAWVPKVFGPGDAITVTEPANALTKLKPGDVFIFNGVAGICELDEHGRLVVIDHAGEVLCIIGPSGVEL